MNDDHLFRFHAFSCFHLPSSNALKSAGVYISGALYAIGFWAFIDAAVFSKTVNGSYVHITFVDWIPAICSSLGMLVVNSIEKSRLLDDNFASGSSSSWQVRLVLFLGFSLLAGGLAGSIIVLVMKFIVKELTQWPTLLMGTNNVIANSCIMLSCIVLWISQNMEDEYSYSLTL